MNQTLSLIDQLIFIENQRDKEWKAAMLKLGRGTEAIGESVMLQNLKNLREICMIEKLELEAQMMKVKI